MKDLIKIDGYDTTFSKNISQVWNDRINLVINFLDIDKDDFLVEIGSGSGAITYSIQKKIFPLRIVAIDYAFPLLKISKKVNRDIVHIQATANSLPLKNNFVNKIIAYGVLLYFPDYDYAFESLKEMDRILAHKGKIILMDIPDFSKKKMCEEIRMRTIGKEIYRKKYTSCSHLYYRKAFFTNFAKDFNYKIIFFETPDEAYPMSSFRYHVLLER